MSQTAPELVQIGVGSARITTVTRQRLEYLDEAGQECAVDLPQCVRNWVRYKHDHRDDFLLWPGHTEASASEWDSRCVGTRGASDDPPWVEFMNARHTRFEFRTYEEIYSKLLNPLKEVGWHTFDMT